MSTRLAPRLVGGAAALIALPAIADVPSVATDIAPVQSLVAQVMGDLGTPALVVRHGASPHDYTLRPSEAEALQSADLVVWMGDALTPWLAPSLDALAGDAVRLSLLQADTTQTLPYREGIRFDAARDHGHDHHGDDDHDHGHAHDHGDHAHSHDHAHEGVDPHAWLDPENGKAWLGLIADTLARIDPENAQTYRDNADGATARIDTAMADADETLSGMDGAAFVTFHDAYQYFEDRYDLPMVAAIALGDATAPSPARIDALQAAIAEAGVTCALTEPQFDRRLIDTVFAGTDVTIGTIDPLGSEIPTGPNFYTDLIGSVATSFAECS